MMNPQFTQNSYKSPCSIPFPPYVCRTIQISKLKYLQNYSFRPFYCPFGTFVNWHTNTRFKVTGCAIQERKVLEPEDAALLVSRCITQTLPPALTLEQGLDRIQEAVEELKSKPPCSSSGMFRFQVAVPPSAKALNWFCSQHDSSEVFPRFFVSEEDNVSYKSLLLGRTRGVFGIGAAVLFKVTYSRALVDYRERKRYPAIQSSSPMSYGFLDVNIDLVSSSVKHEIGSCYFFVPQIELDELKEVPVLTATLAWNCSAVCCFKDAIQAYEYCLYQVS